MPGFVDILYSHTTDDRALCSHMGSRAADAMLRADVADAALRKAMTLQQAWGIWATTVREHLGPQVAKQAFRDEEYSGRILTGLETLRATLHTLRTELAEQPCPVASGNKDAALREGDVPLHRYFEQKILEPLQSLEHTVQQLADDPKCWRQDALEQAMAVSIVQKPAIERQLEAGLKEFEAMLGIPPQRAAFVSGLPRR